MIIAQPAPAVNGTAMPTLSVKSPAYVFGFEDAALREPFCPEMYFARDRDTAAYTLGFLSVQPTNAAALSYWADFIAAEDERREYEDAEAQDAEDRRRGY